MVLSETHSYSGNVDRTPIQQRPTFNSQWGFRSDGSGADWQPSSLGLLQLCEMVHSPALLKHIAQSVAYKISPVLQNYFQQLSVVNRIESIQLL